MSVHNMRYRALIGSYDRGGAGGRISPRYLLQPSADSDQAWWCAMVQPTGNEVTTGMKEEHKIDVIFLFHERAPITENGIVEVAGVQYYVRATLPRPFGHNFIQVYGERTERPITLQ